MRDIVEILFVAVACIVCVLLGMKLGEGNTKFNWEQYLICVESTPEVNCEEMHSAPQVDY